MPSQNDLDAMPEATVKTRRLDRARIIFYATATEEAKVTRLGGFAEEGTIAYVVNTSGGGLAEPTHAGVRIWIPHYPQSGAPVTATIVGGQDAFVDPYHAAQFIYLGGRWHPLVTSLEEIL